MENRKVEIIYKDIVITTYKGSNWVYVGSRIFNTLNGAKRHITKVINHFDNVEMVREFYIKKL